MVVKASASAQKNRDILFQELSVTASLPAVLNVFARGQTASGHPHTARELPCQMTLIGKTASHGGLGDGTAEA